MYIKDIIAASLSTSNFSSEYTYSMNENFSQQFKNILNDSITRMDFFTQKKDHIKGGKDAIQIKHKDSFASKTSLDRVDAPKGDECRQSDLKAEEKHKTDEWDKDENIKGLKNVLDKIKQLMNRLRKDNLSKEEKVLLMDELNAMLGQMSILASQQEPLIQQQIYNFMDMLHQELPTIISEGESDAGVNEISINTGEEINHMPENFHNLNIQEIEEFKGEDNLMEDHPTVMDSAKGDGQELSTNLQQDEVESGQPRERTFILSEKIDITDLRNTTGEANVPLQSPMLTTKNDIIISEMIKNPGEGFDKQKIIEYVVKNVRLTLTEDKSEMLLQLKPDHLGKLFLKIVTERGMLIAKFTAQNQQVKEIIESNLDQLREALESQGLNVKGFTVSVGDGNQDTRNMNYERNRRFSKKLKDGEDMDSTKGILNYASASTNINPYHVSDSSFDSIA